MIYKDIIFKRPWFIKLSKHARDRAKERNIPGLVIEYVIINGKIKRFGKDYIKFVYNFKERKITCIGQIKEGNKILILTVEG